MSKCEDYISTLLQREHISYEREKTFSDLKNGTFRFDFYLPNINGRPVIIEYDGQQHFAQIPKFYKKRTDFLKSQEHDRQKNSYCLAHNIELYRIPYWELSKIKCVNDLMRPQYHVESRWHNDLLHVPKK